MRASHTRVLDQMAGAGMARAWEGTLSTGLVNDGHLQALKAAEAMEEAKRVTAMTTRAMGPLQQFERIGTLQVTAAQQYLRTPLAARGFLSPDRLDSVFGASSIGAAARLAEASMTPFARQLNAFGTIAMPRIGLPDGLAGLLERERFRGHHRRALYETLGKLGAVVLARRPQRAPDLLPRAHGPRGDRRRPP